MYTRLWWKEMRAFWPIWAAIAAIAAGVQWFLLWSKLPEARTGLLLVLSIAWATLYACAAGAGVLAGERESKTQVFLDTLPVGRRMLWKGKVSFALATSLALTLALIALGMLGTAQLNRQQYPLGLLLEGSGLVMLEGVAWSLLWSVILGSSLQAALAGVLTVGALSVLLMHDRNLWGHTLMAPILSPLIIPRLVLAGAALGVSWLVFTQQPHPNETRSARRMRTRQEPRIGGLIWETVRESRRTWVLLAGAWIGLFLLTRFSFWRFGDAGLWLVFGILVIGVPAGVSVFGSANLAQTYRFLAYHGVPPGRVWSAKLIVWGIVMTGLLCLFAMLSSATSGWSPRRAPDRLQASFLIGESFVLGVLAGQVVRRSITAWVMATFAFVLLVLPQLGLWASSLIPIGSLALFPALVLLISRAWTGDWMNDLRGATRWLRLGGMIGAAATLLVTLYIGYRGWSVPDIGPPFEPHAAAAPRAALPPDQDAGPDYRRLIAESRARDVGTNYVDRNDKEMIQIVDWSIVADGWDPNREPMATWWGSQRILVEPIHRAAAKSAATFPPSGRSAAAMSPLILLLGLDNFERRSRGDLAGAWDDLRAAFQITNQFGQSGTYQETNFASTWRMQTLQWALVWAGDSRQTAAQLRAALAELRMLLPPFALIESLDDEYTRRARVLRGKSTGLVDSIQSEAPATWSILHVLPASPWERGRALRVLRLLYSRQLELASHEPWQQNPALTHADFDWYVASTPLVRSLVPNDTLVSFNTENVLLSRALVQVVALRIWQLEHGGQYPETLEALVPGLLPGLPPDPYSGQPFRYRRAQGQKLLPLGMEQQRGYIRGESPWSKPAQQGQWLLYSVGPDGQDNGTLRDYEQDPVHADLIFPLPPEPRPEDATGQSHSPAKIRRTR